ncbi:MAG TPA: hypothetical protein VMU32_05435 [Solirubrobacteraceae bacterium]|nr:hypothetical protein [Solirubrobacteraceae bacterium]
MEIGRRAGQEVDAAPGVFPIAELLTDHQQVIAEHADVIAEKPLQVRALAESEIGERHRLVRRQTRVGNLVQRHSARSLPPRLPTGTSAATAGGERNLARRVGSVQCG